MGAAGTPPREPQGHQLPPWRTQQLLPALPLDTCLGPESTPPPRGPSHPAPHGASPGGTCWPACSPWVLCKESHKLGLCWASGRGRGWGQGLCWAQQTRGGEGHGLQDGPAGQEATSSALSRVSLECDPDPYGWEMTGRRAYGCGAVFPWPSRRWRLQLRGPSQPQRLGLKSGIRWTSLCAGTASRGRAAGGTTQSPQPRPPDPRMETPTSGWTKWAEFAHEAFGFSIRFAGC